jgi:hypothetical protein
MAESSSGGRDTTKHGPRLDDQLKRETRGLEQGAPLEPRVEEWREHEPPGEDDPDVDARPASGSLGSDPVEARRELSRHLRLTVFPADREALVREAAEMHAPADVSSVLQSLPPDITFANVHEVWACLSGYDDLRSAAAHEPLTDGER